MLALPSTLAVLPTCPDALVTIAEKMLPAVLAFACEDPLPPVAVALAVACWPLDVNAIAVAFAADCPAKNPKETPPTALADAVAVAPGSVPTEIAVANA